MRLRNRCPGEKTLEKLSALAAQTEQGLADVMLRGCDQVHLPEEVVVDLLQRLKGGAGMAVLKGLAPPIAAELAAEVKLTKKAAAGAEGGGAAGGGWA